MSLAFQRCVSQSSETRCFCPYEAGPRRGKVAQRRATVAAAISSLPSALHTPQPLHAEQLFPDRCHFVQREKPEKSTRFLIRYPSSASTFYQPSLRLPPAALWGSFCHPYPPELPVLRICWCRSGRGGNGEIAVQGQGKWVKNFKYNHNSGAKKTIWLPASEPADGQHGSDVLLVADPTVLLSASQCSVPQRPDCTENKYNNAGTDA